MKARSARMGLFCLLLLGPALCLAQEPAAALNPFTEAERQASEQQALEGTRSDTEALFEEVERLEAGIDERIAGLDAGDLTADDVEQARVDLESSQLQQEEALAQSQSMAQRIASLEKAVADLTSQEQLLQNPELDETDEAQRVRKLADVRTALEQRRSALQAEQRRLEVFNTRSELLSKRVTVQQRWFDAVAAAEKLQRERARQEEQADVRQRLLKQQAELKEESSRNRQRLTSEAASLSLAQRRLIESLADEADEQAKLIDLDIKLAEWSSELGAVQALLEDEQIGVEALEDGLRRLFEVQRGVETSMSLLQRKVELYGRKQEVIATRAVPDEAASRASAEESAAIEDLLVALRQRTVTLTDLAQQAEQTRSALDTRHAEVLSQNLLARNPLPTSLEEWQAVLENVAAMPTVLVLQTWLSTQGFVTVALAAGVETWAVFAGLALVLLVIAVLARRWLLRVLDTASSRQGVTVSQDIVLLFAQLVRRNLVPIVLASLLVLALGLFKTPDPAWGILLTLTLFLLGIKLAAGLAQSLLAAPDMPAEQRRPGLYAQSVGAAVLGGGVVCVALLARLSDVPDATLISVDRLLAVCLLAVLVPVVRARAHVMRMLASQYPGSWRVLAARSISLLIPLALLAIACLGIAGYANLARSIAWHASVIVAVTTAWLVVQSCLNQVKGTLVRRSFGSSKPFPSLMREIVASVHRLLSILLALLTLSLLYHVYDWQSQYTLGESSLRILALAVLLVIVVYELLYILAGHGVRSSGSVLAEDVLRNTRRPVGLILPLTAAQIVTPRLELEQVTSDFIMHVLVLTQIAAISWLIVRIIALIDDHVARRYHARTGDRLAARRVHTQVRMLRQIVIMTVYMIAIAAMLMTFPTVRQLGTGLIASAGVAGLFIGVAARPLLENLIAGIQIGLTQPIRLGDHVIVEGEWGSIEEITPTYVVVHIWDDRRLIVPLNYFNTQPFQNWTRSSTSLIGSVFLSVDYTFPVEAGREELQRILESTDLWDGRVSVLQVTDATEHTVTLRALMTAKDAPTAWDLRCYAREKLLEFVQREYPQCLPKTRAWLGEEDRPKDRDAGARAGAPLLSTG